jgi:hypothetical protein
MLRACDALAQLCLCGRCAPCAVAGNHWPKLAFFHSFEAPRALEVVSLAFGAALV